MAEIVCVCNGVFDEDLRDYLARTPIDSIDTLRAKERICNKCRQCEPTVVQEIARAIRQRNQKGKTASGLDWDEA